MRYKIVKATVPTVEEHCYSLDKLHLFKVQKRKFRYYCTSSCRPRKLNREGDLCGCAIEQTKAFLKDRPRLPHLQASIEQDLERGVLGGGAHGARVHGGVALAAQAQVTTR